MFSLSFSRFISLALSFVLFPCHSFAPSLPLSFSLSLPVLQFIRDRMYVCISTSLFSPHRRFRENRVYGRLKFRGKSMSFSETANCEPHFTNRRDCSKQVLSRNLTPTLKRHLTMYKPGSEVNFSFPNVRFELISRHQKIVRALR